MSLRIGGGVYAYWWGCLYKLVGVSLRVGGGVSVCW